MGSRPAVPDAAAALSEAVAPDAAPSCCDFDTQHREEIRSQRLKQCTSYRFVSGRVQQVRDRFAGHGGSDENLALLCTRQEKNRSCRHGGRDVSARTTSLMETVLRELCIRDGGNQLNTTPKLRISQHGCVVEYWVQADSRRIQQV